MQKMRISHFGADDGRIASLILVCVTSHTALGAPNTASRQQDQKRDFDNFRIPYRVGDWRERSVPGAAMAQVSSTNRGHFSSSARYLS